MTAIVCCSDLHLDHTTHGVSRFDEVKHAVFESVERAIQIRAAAWMCLGDVTDPDSGPIVFRVLEVLIEATQRLIADAVPVVFLAGNHDIALADGTTTLSPLRPLVRSSDYVELFEQPGVVDLDRLPRIVAFPFTHPSCSYDPAEWARAQVERSDRPTITISHLNIEGVQPGEETKELPRGRSVLFPCAETKRAVHRVSGHYHRAQDFDPKDGGPPISIVGSCAKLTFGEEEHEPSFLILEV